MKANQWCGIVVPAVLLLGLAGGTNDVGTITIHADRMTFTNQSTPDELLLGVIKAENVLAENVTIFNWGVTIKVDLIESPFMILKVTHASLIMLGIRYIGYLPSLALSEQVTWEDVTLETEWLQTNAMSYERMVISL